MNRLLLFSSVFFLFFNLTAEAGGCTGCGCRGGPGYRGPDGHCVGKKKLSAVCGVPPTTRCKFEGR